MATHIPTILTVTVGALVDQCSKYIAEFDAEIARIDEAVMEKVRNATTPDEVQSAIRSTSSTITRALREQYDEDLDYLQAVSDKRGKNFEVALDKETYSHFFRRKMRAELC